MLAVWEDDTGGSPGVTMSDIFGTNGSDTVNGTNGDDSIHGGELHGLGSGPDVGNDTLNGRDGNDRLWGEGGDDVLNGDDGDDFLFGDIGDDTCNGGAGNDTIEVTRGNDIVNGGTGTDLLTFFEKSAGITISLAITVAQDSGDGIYTIHNIENLTGGFSNDTLIGNDGDNVIQGGTHAFGYDGNDWLDGGAGHDTLIGNRGTDTLTGGIGDDTLKGGDDDDTYILDTIYRPDVFAKFRYDAVIEYTYGGIDTVKVQRVGNTAAYTLVANVENGIVTGTETFTLSGNELANQLTGNEAANTLNGLAGNDSLNGLAGNDVLDGGTGEDMLAGGTGEDIYKVDNAGDVIVEAAGQGRDRIYALVSYRLAGDAEVEILNTASNGGTTSINLTGNEFVQTIIGNAGNNIINGLGGADTMQGLGGSDEYYVDNSADVVIETIGGGSDRIYASANYSLKSGVEVETLSTNDANVITALKLAGNSFANTIIGNAGNNFLNGATGADTLTGLGGNDIFMFNTAIGGGNIDDITDFNVADDTIRLDNAIFASIAGTGVLTAAQFVANTSGTALDADDHIIYETDTGRLIYDANGSTAGGRYLVATLDAGLAMTNADFFIV
jgi:Ca2+-binding RTX toxin-like protein